MLLCLNEGKDLGTCSVFTYIDHQPADSEMYTLPQQPTALVIHALTKENSIVFPHNVQLWN